MTLRTANNDEAAALIFTFGNKNGNRLINYIRIGTGERESEKQREVLLAENYKSADLYYLGIFIRKATRVWQKYVERYHRRSGGGDYNYRDLYRLREVKDRENGSIDINSKQHARAVRDWFWVTYGSAAYLIGPGSRQLTVEYLSERIAPVLEVDLQYTHRFGEDPFDGQEAALVHIINNHYACVIEELRRDSY